MPRTSPDGIQSEVMQTFDHPADPQKFSRSFLNISNLGLACMLADQSEIKPILFQIIACLDLAAVRIPSAFKVKCYQVIRVSLNKNGNL